MSEPARRSQESGNQLIEGVDAAERPTGALEYAPSVAENAQDLGPLAGGTVTGLLEGTSTDASFSSSSDGSGPVRLIGEGETSQAMQAAAAAAGSLGAEALTTPAPVAEPVVAGLLSTAGVAGTVSDTGNLTLSAASVGAALAATGAPLNVAAVPSTTDSATDNPGDATSDGSGDGGSSRPEPTEPHAFVPDPTASPVSPPSGTPLGLVTPAAPAQSSGSPLRANRSPDTGAFVPREMVARRRAAEAMTRAIVMAPPLPPSMLTGSQPVQTPPAPQTPAQPVSGPITQPQTPGAAETAVDHAAAGSGRTRLGAKNRKRAKGRKHGAHTAGIPLAATGSNPQVAPVQQPPTGPMPAPGVPGAPGTGALPMGYAPQAYPQGYPPQAYPQGYLPQGYAPAPQAYAPQHPQQYVPQGYVPQGYVPQGYQQGVPSGAMPLSAMGSVGVGVPPQQQIAPPGPQGPSKRARWGMFAAVVLVVGGIIAGVLLAPDNDDKDPAVSASTGPSPSASATQAAPTESLSFTTATFDPADGEGIQTKGDLYESQSYKTATFGNLKPGVGLVIDLGGAKKVSEISFTSVGSGPVTVGLQAADELSTKDLSSYQEVVAQKEETGKVTFDASKAKAHRYWMVWVTSLPMNPGSTYPYKAIMKNVKVTGPKG